MAFLKRVLRWRTNLFSPCPDNKSASFLTRGYPTIPEGGYLLDSLSSKQIVLLASILEAVLR